MLYDFKFISHSCMYDVSRSYSARTSQVGPRDNQVISNFFSYDILHDMV